MEEIAIQLWNWAVTKRVGSTITEEQKAKGLSHFFSVYYCICLLISVYLPIICLSVLSYRYLFLYQQKKVSKSISRCLHRCQLFDKLQICLTHCTCFSAPCGMQTSVFMRAWEPIREYRSQAVYWLWICFCLFLSI